MLTWPEWSGDDGYAEQPSTPPFGYQLCLDCYDCNAETMFDIRHVYTFLETLVDELGMTRQAPPYVFLSPPEFKDKAGISAWVPLIESHICLDTLALRRMVSIDIFCCRQFDAERVQALALAFFAPGEIERSMIRRGSRYHLSG